MRTRRLLQKSNPPKSKFVQVGQNLQRYVPSGIYYARIKVAGKIHKKSLETDVATVAKLKLSDFEKELRTQAERQREAGKTKHGDLTVEGATQEYITAFENNPDLKSRTKEHKHEIIGAIRKTWPELFTIEVRAVSAKQCEAWAARLRKHGTGPQALADARAMGVAHPEKIRVMYGASMPVPTHPGLLQAGRVSGLISPHTGGMAFRYGIFIRSDVRNDRQLLAHECVHTGQYERLGSIAEFLTQYLTQCIEIGYPAAPLEQEAITKAAALP